MKITITLHDGEVRRLVPLPSGERAAAEGPCPLCGAEELAVAGTGTYREGHDTYAARGITLCCGEPCGTIRAQVDTIFGIEEDDRVLHGRCRVY
jgi:hypothetical protein